MTQDDVYRLQYLAGIINKQGDTIKPTDESNISIVGSAKGQYMRKHNVQPGTDEWFKLWFSRPKLTGEDPTPKQGG